MKAFERFQQRCEMAGLKAIDCGQGHWQIVNEKWHILNQRRVVNWYPVSKKRTIYINQTSGRISFNGSEALAIEAALGNLGKEKQKRVHGGLKIKLRKKLLREDSHCFKCRLELNKDTATLDHIIPLAKGGTNIETNFQLACVGCNISKGDSIIVDSLEKA